jgi:hypothetical protein
MGATVCTAESFRIRTPNGAGFAFCTEEHSRRWLLGAAHSHRGSPLHPGGPASAGELLSCSTCAWCGNRVEAPAPGACILHDEGCPAWAPKGTLAVQRAIEQLTAMIGAPLPQAVFGYVEDVAQGQHESGTWPGLVDLVLDVWVEYANRVGLTS